MKTAFGLSVIIFFFSFKFPLCYLNTKFTLMKHLPVGDGLPPGYLKISLDWTVNQLRDAITLVKYLHSMFTILVFWIIE